MNDLPDSFRLFKVAIQYAEAEGMFSADTPQGKATDKVDWATFVRRMPEMVSKIESSEAQEAYRKFLADPRVNRADPMADVIGLVDLYGRSALGGSSEKISARQFGDFYSSELVTRYTGSLGTGTVVEALLKKLAHPSRKLRMLTNAPVAQIEDGKDTASVTYLRDGKVIRSSGKKIVFAAPITLAPRLIKDFAQSAPERMQAIEAKDMTDYNVYILRLKGHPFRLTYDLWVRSEDYTEADGSDVIAGRWQDKNIQGYKGMREFEKDPKDDYGVHTIYHPLGPAKKTRTREEMLADAEFAIDRMNQAMKPILAETGGGPIEIELIEMNQWPHSIHVVRPGSLEADAPLALPLGRIHFANNTLGAPEFEEALVRGHDAAMAILAELRKEKPAQRDSSEHKSPSLNVQY